MAESFISARWSKDGGYTWSDWRARSLGEVGDFGVEAIWRQLGVARRLTFDFRADGAPDIVAAYVMDARGEWVEAPIVGGMAQDNARLWTYQDTVNYIPVLVEHEGATARWILRGAPGNRLFATAGTGPHRGAREVEGKYFVVSGLTLYQVNRDTSVTSRGTIPGTGRVTLTHNQEGGGSKVAIATGNRGYVYDTVLETLTQIGDEAFPGFLVCDYLDQYILGIEPQRRFAFHSDLADASSYSAIDRFEAESAPDRLMGMAVIGGQWWLFGERTTEVYANTGAATGTFQRIPGATIDRGLAGTHAVAKLDNALWILGDDGNVYRSNGYSFVRVSDHQTEQTLRLYDMTQVFFETYEDAGHKILYVTCPDGPTLGYDVASKLWHRRESFGLNRWRMSTLTKWAGVWMMGDYQNGSVYQVDWNLRDESDEPLVGRRTTGTLVNSSNRFTISGVKVDVDTGRTPAALTGIHAIIDPLIIFNPMPIVYAGEVVSHQYRSAGGIRPHTFSITAGALPTGLSMDSDGLVTGTPTTPGEYAWRVQVLDAQGFTATLDQGQDDSPLIEGDAVYNVGYAPPLLMTNVKTYGGTRDTLAPADDPVGWVFGIDHVSVSPNGLYAVGADTNATTGTYIEFKKFNAVTRVWDALSLPAEVPSRGPAYLAWHPDGGYLAMAVATATAADRLWIYKLSGDTFTKIDPPDDHLPQTPSFVAWDKEGNRLALVQSITTSGIVVYDFLASTDTVFNQQIINTGTTHAYTSVAFQPTVGSRYIAAGTTSSSGLLRVFSLDTLALVISRTCECSTRIFWDASGSYLITVGITPPDYCQVWNFDGSVIGMESLDLVDVFAGQPAGIPGGASMTRDRQHLAVAWGSSNFPSVWQTPGIPPTPVKLTDPATAGAEVNQVRWSEFGE